MIHRAADPGIFGCRDAFLARAVEKLGAYPSDFSSISRQMELSGKSDAPRQAAGVLVPLLFRPSPPGARSGMQFVFQLIKRSSRVSQPGDLSCPGGMMHPFIDRLMLPLLTCGPFSILRGEARRLVRQRDPATRRLITLFLVNALRETWEELGISPFHVRYLGPLPTYSLRRFRRTIFPLAGFVEKPAAFTPNREVEKIVEIPLAAFYDAESIGCYALASPDPADPSRLQSLNHPCLIHPDSDGREEILWGATFHILTAFLTIVMDYRLPEWEKGRCVRRALPPDYLAERPASKRFFP